MIGKLATFLLTVILVIGIALIIIDIHPAKAGMISVPDDYSTIQEAIDAAQNGDTVLVHNGTYYENVVVNKTITLIGTSPDKTFIKAGNSSINVINVTSSNVNITGFNVNGANASPFMPCGIYLRGVSNVSLWNNYLTGNTVAICLDNSRDCTISNNTVFSNYWGIDLRVGDYDNTIAGNIANSNVWFGIRMWSGSGNNLIVDNFLTDNQHCGVTLGYCSNNTIAFNNISGNLIGAEIQEISNNNTFYSNNFVDNTEQAGGYHISDSINAWDNGYPAGGNYWSDYNGVDSNLDGFGDTPYVIDANNTDRYPLMTQYIIPEFLSLLILPMLITLILLTVKAYQGRTIDRAITSLH